MSDYDSDNQERKAHHNALERKRRDEIKGCFISLRDSVPSIRGKSVTRSHILKSTSSFIVSTRKKTLETREDIEALERQNKMLVTQIIHVTNAIEERKDEALARGDSWPPEGYLEGRKIIENYTAGYCSVDEDDVGTQSDSNSDEDEDDDDDYYYE